LKKLCTIALLLAFTGILQAQPLNKGVKQLTRIEFVFDSSQSMWSRWESSTKMDVSKNLLCNLIDSLRKIDNLELALRVYGHQKNYPPQDCDDTKLEVPFGPLNHKRIKDKVNSLSPSGTTPIALSLIACENDFPDRNARNIIILITDGKEECGGDPCAVSLALQRKGIVLKPFIIGVGLDVTTKSAFDCMGKYYDANTEAAFKNILNIVISQALNNTSAQVNILDKYNKPTESNIDFTLYDSNSGIIKYNYIHTLNTKGVPDTLYIDPISTYKLVVHTIPPVEKTDITLTPGKHNTIGINAPTGYLYLKQEGKSDYGDLKCIIRKANEFKTLHVQSFGRTDRLLEGKYDLEILTTPRITLSKVDITQSSTTTIEIPKPGLVSLQMPTEGYGAIFLEDKGKLEFVLNLDDTATYQNYVLQPGHYRVVYRRRGANETLYTVEKPFVIESSKSVALNLK
jgi:Ca-activated chloride channel family protein